MRSTRKAKTLVLVPTMDCQLRCSFCLCLDSLGKGEGSSTEDMIKFLAWQIELDPEASFLIEVFGGEPTLAYPKIKEVYLYIKKHYKDKDISWTLFTNGVFPKTVERDFEFFIHMWDEIIISIEGPPDTASDRHPSPITHKKAIDNFKRCLPYGKTGVAFVVFPDTDLSRIFNYFADMGCRYFNFEIVTHVNVATNVHKSLEQLLSIFEFIYENILLWNLEHFEYMRVFTIPREYLAAHHFKKAFPNKGCIDSVRALAPSGNIYFCRDMAVNEPKLKEQSNLIFSSKLARQYNIKDFELDIESDSFKEDIRQYEMWNSCPLKSMEHYHFVGGKQEWIHNKDFQDLVVRPMFELGWLGFEIFFKDTFSQEEYEDYQKKVLFYGEVLNIYRTRCLDGD